MPQLTTCSAERSVVTEPLDDSMLHTTQSRVELSVSHVDSQSSMCIKI